MEGKGGKEVRRINVIYFLNRNGEFEQPHLFRIHHFTRNGVYLRDVKRWITQLRGEDIAATFTWSYKRKYKQMGFVWQDLLMDKDLLTPISDNEYILKGTQISSTPIYDDVSSYDEKGAIKHRTVPILQSTATDQENSSGTEEEKPRFSVKPYIVTYKSVKLDKDTNSLETAQPNNEYERFENTCFFNSRFLCKSTKNVKNGIDDDKSTVNSSSGSTRRSSSSNRSDSRGSSNMLRNNVSRRVMKENIATSKRIGLSSLVGLFIPQQIIS